jgi:predicted MFS family arabinose efflux permease
MAVALLTGIGYVAIAFVTRVALLLLIATAAMFNGMGRDRGPASALEQAVLPATTTSERRTWTLAWYNAAIDSGHAVGALGAIIPTMLVSWLDITGIEGHAWAFALCGTAIVLSIVPYALLTPEIDRDHSVRGSAGPLVVDDHTRTMVRKLAALFTLDSIGGGFLNSALVAYWFFERYGTSEAQLAGLFFAARTLNVVSHLGAAWMARHVGLLNTMVVTHLPSSVFLMIAPAAPTAALAAVLFLAREALVEMDVPTRQSYVMAVVPRPARTYASGMTNVTRNAGWAVGPLLGGTVMQHLTLAAPLFIGGTLKIVYDVLLYRSFRRVRPPEEVS